ncbi:hypothetical protein QJQ45_015354, partial [Haematococcus lacustris]
WRISLARRSPSAHQCSCRELSPDHLSSTSRPALYQQNRTQQRLQLSTGMGDVLPSSFTVMATGQIESAVIPGCSNAYLKFQLVAGEDWQLLDGLEEGITQASRASQGPDQALVWNYPLDLTYKTTNAYGWPQLVVSVYGLDGLGRDVIKGYGCIHLPTAAG